MQRTFAAILCGIALIIGAGLLIIGTPVHAQDGTSHTHIVQPGENLFRIALHYQISVDVLMRINGLQDADVVVTGQALIIPETGSFTASQTTVPGAVIHTVAIGDTLLNISRRYGVSPDAIMQANSLVDPSLLVTGQPLIIPGATGTIDLGIMGTKPQFAPITVEMPADLGIIQPANANPASAAVSAPNPAPATTTTQTVSSAPSDEAPNAVANPVPDAPAQPDSAADSAEPSPDTAPAVAAAEPAVEPAAEPVEPVTAVNGAPDPNVIPPDLGIIAPENAAPPAPEPALIAKPEPDSAPPQSDTLAAPDLGIINPNTAAWQLVPGILTTGGPRVRAIYVQGQALGNNPRAFSKIGDCNSEPPFFLAKFDQGDYDLGPYAYLQPVLDQFAGSFERKSMSAWTGAHAWALFDSTWSNPAFCQPGETPIACEFRVNRPSLVLIRMGTNEANSPQLYEANMRRIIEFSIERGVIPVLGTKADRIEGSDAINEITRALAGEYEIPLWDFGRVADTLPARGLQADGFHMNYVLPDYTMPAALQTGHSVQNLLALMALNTVWHSAMY